MKYRLENKNDEACSAWVDRNGLQKMMKRLKKNKSELLNSCIIKDSSGAKYPTSSEIKPEQ